MDVIPVSPDEIEGANGLMNIKASENIDEIRYETEDIVENVNSGEEKQLCEGILPSKFVNSEKIDVHKEVCDANKNLKDENRLTNSSMCTDNSDVDLVINSCNKTLSHKDILSINLVQSANCDIVVGNKLVSSKEILSCNSFENDKLFDTNIPVETFQQCIPNCEHFKDCSSNICDSISILNAKCKFNCQLNLKTNENSEMLDTNYSNLKNIINKKEKSDEIIEDIAKKNFNDISVKHKREKLEDIEGSEKQGINDINIKNKREKLEEYSGGSEKKKNDTSIENKREILEKHTGDSEDKDIVKSTEDAEEIIVDNKSLDNDSNILENMNFNFDKLLKNSETYKSSDKSNIKSSENDINLLDSNLHNEIFEISDNSEIDKSIADITLKTGKLFDDCIIEENFPKEFLNMKSNSEKCALKSLTLISNKCENSSENNSINIGQGTLDQGSSSLHINTDKETYDLPKMATEQLVSELEDIVNVKSKICKEGIVLSNIFQDDVKENSIVNNKSDLKEFDFITHGNIFDSQEKDCYKLSECQLRPKEICSSINEIHEKRRKLSVSKKLISKEVLLETHKNNKEIQVQLKPGMNLFNSTKLSDKKEDEFVEKITEDSDENYISEFLDKKIDEEIDKKDYELCKSADTLVEIESCEEISLSCSAEEYFNTKIIKSNLSAGSEEALINNETKAKLPLEENLYEKLPIPENNLNKPSMTITEGKKESIQPQILNLELRPEGNIGESDFNMDNSTPNSSKENSLKGIFTNNIILQENIADSNPISKENGGEEICNLMASDHVKNDISLSNCSRIIMLNDIVEKEISDIKPISQENEGNDSGMRGKCSLENDFNVATTKNSEISQNKVADMKIISTKNQKELIHLSISDKFNNDSSTSSSTEINPDKVLNIESDEKCISLENESNKISSSANRDLNNDNLSSDMFENQFEEIMTENEKLNLISDKRDVSQGNEEGTVDNSLNKDLANNKLLSCSSVNSFKGILTKNDENEKMKHVSKSNEVETKFDLIDSESSNSFENDCNESISKRSDKIIPNYVVSTSSLPKDNIVEKFNGPGVSILSTDDCLPNVTSTGNGDFKVLKNKNEEITFKHLSNNSKSHENELKNTSNSVQNKNLENDCKEIMNKVQNSEGKENIKEEVGYSSCNELINNRLLFTPIKNDLEPKIENEKCSEDDNIQESLELTKLDVKEGKISKSLIKLNNENDSQLSNTSVFISDSKGKELSPIRDIEFQRKVQCKRRLIKDKTDMKCDFESFTQNKFYSLRKRQKLNSRINLDYENTALEKELWESVNYFQQMNEPDTLLSVKNVTLDSIPEVVDITTPTKIFDDFPLSTKSKKSKTEANTSGGDNSYFEGFIVDDNTHKQKRVFVSEMFKFGIRECKVNLSCSKVNEKVLRTKTRNSISMKPNYLKLKQKLEAMIHDAKIEGEDAKKQLKRMRAEKSTMFESIVVEIEKIKTKYTF